MFSHTECHLSATQQCNSTLITTITKILQKLFLNIFFQLAKGTTSQTLLHCLARNKNWITWLAWQSINKNQCERSQRKWINEAQSFSWELWKSSGPDMIGSSIKILALSQKLGICCHRWPRWRIDHLTIVMCYLSLLRFLEMAKKNQQCVGPLKWEIGGESDKMLFDFIFWVG